MRSSMAASVAAAILTFAGFVAPPVFAADAGPTLHQIYEAAQTGHLDQAQQMIDQVLREYPQSAKAHFVQAELYARQGKAALARAQLSQAEQLKPGLPNESPRAVQALKAQLGIGQGGIGQRLADGPRGGHFPWGMVLILVAAIGVLWMLLRRRPASAQYAAGPAGAAPGGYAGPGGMYGGPAGPMGGGLGSGIAGGLASGLAVGAGVVAGEQLAHHFLDGGRSQSGSLPAPDDAAGGSANSDMGGADFGVNDPGSWDDSSGGDSGGGDSGGGDWS